jgi:putative ABC transport system permease protein
VFGFSLAAGVLVLYAALAATQDARAREYHLLRVLGARSKQINRAVITEFALIGLLAGLVATLGASVLAWALSRFALHLPYTFNPMLLLWGVGLAVGGIPLAAWMGLRRIMGRAGRGDS